MTGDPLGLDLDRLGRYLRRRRPDLAPAGLAASLIAGGRSNLTYLVTAGPVRWVLRRPPLGHVLASAHDMSREHRAIGALADTSVPVPRPLLLCTDPDVLGVPFYLMEYIEGRVVRSDADAAELGPLAARQLSIALVDVLTDLHGIDPDTVGLSDFGRPIGFLERQLRRWWQQFQASRSRELSGLDELRDRLAANVPDAQRATIVHGDFRLDNTIVSPPTVRAVLDWEMATLGDPLTDLGMLGVYWELAELAGGNPISTAVSAARGFATMDDLSDRYAERTGLDLTPMAWYDAFSRFKLAIILEGIHYRYQQAQTVGDGFADIGQLVPTLVNVGLDALRRRAD